MRIWLSVLKQEQFKTRSPLDGMTPVVIKAPQGGPASPTEKRSQGGSVNGGRAKGPIVGPIKDPSWKISPGQWPCASHLIQLTRVVHVLNMATRANQRYHDFALFVFSDLVAPIIN